MRPLTRLAMLTLCLSTRTVAAHASSNVPSEAIGPVLQTADRLAAAVRSRSLDGIMSFVAPDGIPCLDDKISRKEVEHQLRTRGTWLNSYFFEPQIFRLQFADGLTPVSFAEFLASAKDLRVLQPAKQNSQFPCAIFVASNLQFRATFCFMRRGRRWYLGDLPNCG